jgi:hypothetical protein
MLRDMPGVTGVPPTSQDQCPLTCGHSRLQTSVLLAAVQPCRFAWPMMSQLGGTADQALVTARL